nr:MAG TPA: hypothetical protein [Caudoviricetes sp.]
MALWHSAAHTVHTQILLHLCKRFTQTHRHWAAFLLWRLLSYHGRRPWKKSSQHLNSND